MPTLNNSCGGDLLALIRCHGKSVLAKACVLIISQMKNLQIAEMKLTEQHKVNKSN